MSFLKPNPNIIGYTRRSWVNQKLEASDRAYPGLADSPWALRCRPLRGLIGSRLVESRSGVQLQFNSCPAYRSLSSLAFVGHMSCRSN